MSIPVKVLSPLPGTFYRKPSATSAPFKEDGSSLKAGEVIGLVEVMKSFHEIRSEVYGSNLRFLGEDGDAVVAGELLAEVDA
jgi:acetyl-CoA carboxylase biotin carboxyl carrier protein